MRGGNGQVVFEQKGWRGLINDPAVEALRRRVTKPCVCRGYITADPEDPTKAVQVHNRTSEHGRWRERTGR
jgi:hypothetical protein